MSAGPAVNPFELLKADHRKVSDLLQEIMQNDSDHQVKWDNIQQIYNDIMLHNRMKETVFYPEITRRNKGLIEHSVEEHRKAEQILQQIMALPVDSNKFMDLVLEVDKALRHHIDEEENKVFKEAANGLTDADLLDIGMRMAAIKESGQPAIERRSLEDSAATTRAQKQACGLKND